MLTEKDYTKEDILVPTQEPFYKSLAIILSFMQNNLYIKGMYDADESMAPTPVFRLKFSNQQTNYVQRLNKIDSLNKFNCKLVYTKNRFRLQIQYDKSYENFKTITDCLLNFKLDPETNKLLLSNGNQMLNKLIFFEENVDLIYNKLKSFNDYSFDTHNIINKINEFYKIKKFIKYFDYDFEIQKNVITRFITFSNKMIDVIKIGPFIFKKENNMILIKFGGVDLFQDVSLNKFKYINHPSLNFILGVMEETGIMNKFIIAINKSLIKTI